MADQDLTCSACGGAFKVAKSTAEELNFEAFCPFCAQPIALSATSSPEGAPSGPREDMKTTTWDSTEAALGRPVAVVAPASGAPAGLVPLALAKAPSSGRTKVFDAPTTADAQLAELPPLDPQDNILTSAVSLPPSPETAGEEASGGGLELDLEDDEAPGRPGASSTEDRWVLEADEGRASDRATILKRIRNGELGPRDLAAPEGSPDELRRELSEIPEFRRYVMLFGRTGSPKDPTKDPFWKRVKRP